jgi:hypothetical protein
MLGCPPITVFYGLSTISCCGHFHFERIWKHVEPYITNKKMSSCVWCFCPLNLSTLLSWGGGLGTLRDHHPSHDSIFSGPGEQPCKTATQQLKNKALTRYEQTIDFCTVTQSHYEGKVTREMDDANKIQEKFRSVIRDLKWGNHRRIIPSYCCSFIFFIWPWKHVKKPS